MTAEIQLTLDGAEPMQTTSRPRSRSFKSPENFERSGAEVSRLTTMQDFRSGVIRFSRVTLERR